MIRILWSQRLHLLPVFFHAIGLCGSAVATYHSACDATRPAREAWLWAWCVAMWLFSLILATSTAILNAETRALREAWREERSS